MGERQMQGIDTAVDKINNAGGVNGAKVVIQYFDCGTDQQGAINAMQLACNTEGLSGILGMFQSAYNLAYSDIVKNAKIPTICLGTSATVRDLKNPYLWMSRICDETTSSTVAKLAVSRGMTKPGIMWMTNSSGQSQYDAITKYLKENNIEIASDLSFNVETETDYTPYVTQFLASDADGLILITNVTQGAPEVISLLGQYGYDMSKVAAVPALFSSDLTNLVDDLVDGMYGVAEFSPKQDREGTRTYVADFESRSDHFTSSWIDAATYDAVLLLAEAAKLAGANDTESVNKGMTMIENFTDGALTDYTYNEDHSLGSTMLVSEFDGIDIVFSDTISAR